MPELLLPPSIEDDWTGLRLDQRIVQHYNRHLSRRGNFWGCRSLYLFNKSAFSWHTALKSLNWDLEAWRNSSRRCTHERSQGGGGGITTEPCGFWGAQWFGWRTETHRTLFRIHSQRTDMPNRYAAFCQCKISENLFFFTVSLLAWLPHPSRTSLPAESLCNPIKLNHKTKQSPTQSKIITAFQGTR